jgi:serine/threonine protein phosphatase PrpC
MLKDATKRKEVLKYQSLVSASHELERRSEESHVHNLVMNCGCTCDVVLITPEEIICANVGDSRCTLATT